MKERMDEGAVEVRERVQSCSHFPYSYDILTVNTSFLPLPNKRLNVCLNLLGLHTHREQEILSHYEILRMIHSAMTQTEGKQKQEHIHTLMHSP